MDPLFVSSVISNLLSILFLIYVLFRFFELSFLNPIVKYSFSISPFQISDSPTDHFFDVSSIKISFVKLSSYNGLESTGKVMELIGLKEVVEDEAIVVLEDIVDTGNTLLKIDEILKAKGKSWQISSLFLKPDAYKGDRKIDFVGFEIPNYFIVGYGLDYDGLGRNLKNVYELAKA